MTWAKVDDRANENPKLLAAGARACWLWTCGLMWANRQPVKTGQIPKLAVGMLYPGLGKPEATKLVEAGLWHDLGDCYAIHDFRVWNPELRQTRAEAGRVGGLRSGASRREAKEEANAKQVALESEASGEAENEARARACVGSDPPPPHPTPDPPVAPQEQTGRRARRGNRGTDARSVAMPDPFEPNAATAKAADDLGLDLAAMMVAMRDKAAAKGWRYVDWQAAARDYMRNEVGYGRGIYTQTPPAQTSFDLPDPNTVLPGTRRAGHECLQMADGSRKWAQA